MRFLRVEEQHEEVQSLICFQLQPGRKITAVIPLVDYEEGKYLLMATKYGVVKKSSIMEYCKYP